MAALTVTTTAAAGVVLPAAAAADVVGDTFANTGRETLHVINGAGSSINVTIVTSGTYNVGAVQYAIADVIVAVANGTTKVIGPFDTTLFGTTVSVTYSSVTTITVRVIALGAG